MYDTMYATHIIINDISKSTTWYKENRNDAL